MMIHVPQQQGELLIAKRKRFALRRYTRQLTSTVRKDADREVLYLDPALAKEMIKDGLVRDLHNRNPDGIILDQFGRVINGDHHVPSIITPKGIEVLHGALTRRG